jgi:tetratricopeptide (TPR) repeat protein
VNVLRENCNIATYYSDVTYRSHRSCMRIQSSAWLITCLSISIGLNQGNGLAATGVDRIGTKNSINPLEIAIETGKKSNCYPSQQIDRSLVSDRRIGIQKKRLSNKVAKAAGYYSAGVDKYHEEDYQGALKDLDRALALNPQHICAYNTRALVKEKLNNIPGAIADYDRAIALGDEHVEYAYANRARLKAEKFNDLQGALTDYNKSIALAPMAYNYLKRGDLKANQLNDIDGALQDYTLAIEFDPEYYYAYVNRAELKADRLNDFKDAIADYDRAIAIAPEIASYYTARARIKVNSQDLPAALADMNKAIDLDRNDAYYRARGYIYRKLNYWQAALVDYNTAIELNSFDDYSYSARGLLKAEQLNDLAGGKADVERAIAIAPKSAGAYTSRGYFKVSYLNDDLGAIKDLDRATELDPKDSYNYRLRGSIKYQKSDNTSAALVDLDRSIVLDSKYIDSYFIRGEIAYTLENKILALKDFNTVIDSNADTDIGEIAKGIIDLDRSQNLSAIAHFDRAFAFATYNTVYAYKYRGIAYRKQGKISEARKDWLKAVELYREMNFTKDEKIVQKWLQQLDAK